MQVLKLIFSSFSLYKYVLAGMILSGLFHYGIYAGIQAGINAGSENDPESFSYIDIKVIPGMPSDAGEAKEEAAEPMPQKLVKNVPERKPQQQEVKNKVGQSEASSPNQVSGGLGTASNGTSSEGASGGSIIKPDYPVRSRMEGEEGKVVYSLSLDGEGKVKDVAVLESSGFKRLDNAAKEALMKSSFAPGDANEKKITFTFRLEDKE